MKQFALILLFSGVFALAQPGPAGNPPDQDGPPPPGAPHRPPLERALRGGPPGRWWNDPQMAQKLGLSSDQQKRMDDIFKESRLRLIDLNAALQKEEVILEPLLSADSPDEPKVLAQIDRVAQARAELEKANARMLLGIRRILTPDQYQKLRAEAPPPRPGGPGPGGPGGPGGRPPRR